MWAGPCLWRAGLVGKLASMDAAISLCSEPVTEFQQRKRQWINVAYSQTWCRNKSRRKVSRKVSLASVSALYQLTASKLAVLAMRLPF